MKPRSHVMVMIALGALMCGKARGEVEVIGPMIVVPNQPIALYFPNLLPPDPDHKILDFRGKADNPNPWDANLWMACDYLKTDAAGLSVEVLLAPIVVHIPAFGTAPFEMYWELPFCPREVSLHFRLEDLPVPSEGVQVGGQFLHECVPVPMPTALPLGIAGIGLLALRRRR